MLSFDEYAKITPNPSYKGYEDYLMKQVDESYEKQVEAIKQSVIDGEDLEGRKKMKEERRNTCPHCNRPLQLNNAVLATTFRRGLLNSRTTFLPAGGWRKRERYKTYEVKYYRCQECDNTIKQIIEIKKRADKLAKIISLIVAIAALIFVVVSAIKTEDDFWTVFLVSLFFGVGGAMFLFVVSGILLERILSKKADEIEKETGIVLDPYFPEVSYAVETDKRIADLQESLKRKNR